MGPDGKYVYTANWFDGTLSVIDVKKRAVIDTIKTGEGSRAFGRFIINK